MGTGKKTALCQLPSLLGLTESAGGPEMPGLERVVYMHKGLCPVKWMDGQTERHYHILIKQC